MPGFTSSFNYAKNFIASNLNKAKLGALASRARGVAGDVARGGGSVAQSLGGSMGFGTRSAFRSYARDAAVSGSQVIRQLGKGGIRGYGMSAAIGAGVGVGVQAGVSEYETGQRPSLGQLGHAALLGGIGGAGFRLGRNAMRSASMGAFGRSVAGMGAGAGRAGMRAASRGAGLMRAGASRIGRNV